MRGEADKTESPGDSQEQRAALERVLASRSFRAAETLSRLLRHIVEQSLEGHGERLKEYSLGVDVLGRSAGFDPRIDSIVRVEASRLRSRLAEYYRTEGASDELRIEIPRGSYVPVFVTVAQVPAVDRPAKKPAQRIVWIAGATFAVVLCSTAVAFLRGRFQARTTPPASIAVIPFVNVRSDEDAAYLTQAVTGETTDALARVRGLRVAARSSVSYVKGSGADVREIGRALGVATVLEGRVEKTGDRLRITAELIGTGDGYYRWSQTYDSPATELSAIPAKIALAVAEDFGLKVPAENGAALLKQRTKSADAYHLVLKGRYLNFAGRSEERLDCYRRALQYDPNYIDAYIGLADEWVRLAAQGTVAPREVMGRAQDAIQKAMALDDNVADAHFIAALIKSSYEWDWPGAERAFQRALQINPNSPNTHIRYARHLALMGRPEDALNRLEQIRRLDPISAELRGVEAAVYYFTRDYDRTIEHARAVLAGQPKVWLLYFWLGRAYESKGMLPEAVDALEKWYGIPAAQQGRGFGMLASVYARAGRKEDALRLLNSMIDASKRTHVSPCSVAIIYIGMRDFERAMEWLEKAYEERDQSLVSLKADPAYDPLRGNPKFASLIRRMKLE